MKYMGRNSMSADLQIREIHKEEFEALGRLMVEAYSKIEGFPTPEQQPDYYAMLANIGCFTGKKDAKVLVAVSDAGELLGGVVYFGDMAEYGSGGTAMTAKHASGIRLLGVDPRFRGMGVGKALTNACIRLARAKAHEQVILHTTQAQRVAWGLYERLGFRRSEDLDFMQQELSISGFRLPLA